MKDTKPSLSLGDVVRIELPEKDMKGDYVVSLIFEAREYGVPGVSRQYNFKKIDTPYMDDCLEQAEVDEALESGKILPLGDEGFRRFEVHYQYDDMPDYVIDGIVVVREDTAENLLNDPDKKDQAVAYLKSVAGDKMDEDDNGVFRVLPTIVDWKELV